MDELIIDNLIKQGASDRLVFAEYLDNEFIGIEICALLNTNGGDIIVGFNNNGNVFITESSLLRLKAYLRKNISPSAPYSINLMHYKNEEIAFINVWPGGSKPYNYMGVIYAKQGVNTIVASNEQLGIFNTERKNSELQWERQAVLGAELEDLDISEITKTLEYYFQDRPEQRDINVEDFLLRLGLMKGGSLTNAAIVLFGNNPTRFLPQCRLRITIYERDKNTNTFLFDRLLDGNLFRNFMSAYEILETYIKKAIVVDGVFRTEKSFPKLAIREGLMNALVHRDYSLVSGNLTIEIFSDKLEITNSGELLGQIKVSDLKKEHGSYLRNPDIANVCFIRRMIEMLGTGTIRMISDCKNNGFPEPEWISENKSTKLIFPGITHQISSERVNDEQFSERFRNDFGMISERIRNEFGESIQETFEIIVKHPNYSAEQIANETSKTSRTIENHLSKLKAAGIISRKGANLGGFWEIN
jgi:ATP-dependent DNA helicase RecG